MGVEHPVRQTAAVCLTGAVMGVAAALAVDPGGLSGKPAEAYLAVFGLGLLPTALASVLSYWLVARVGPSFVAYANYLVPAFALVLGAIALHEPLNSSIAIALALILGGIAVSRMQTLPLMRTAP
jgi:drug/metabolite transporter (DMT)-like permease